MKHDWRSRSWCGFLFVLAAVTTISCVTGEFGWPHAACLAGALGLFTVPNAVKRIGLAYLERRFPGKEG